MGINAKSLTNARKHAVMEFPYESCGLVIGGKYYPCKNVAKEKKNSFSISKEEYMSKVAQFGDVELVVHSHPGGKDYPSRSDMVSQASTNTPFVIISTNGDVASLACQWGDTLPITDLIGRPFMHGVSDCYSLIRDIYRMGKDECAKQSILWPLESIILPEVPRDDAWWELGKDLYADNFSKFGFEQVFDPKPGDIFLIKLKSDKLNHGGVLLSDNQILHHLPTRPSRREPSGIWARGVDMWLRRKEDA